MSSVDYKQITRVAEMVEWLRVQTALTGDLSLVTNTRIRGLITTYNSSPRKSDSGF